VLIVTYGEGQVHGGDMNLSVCQGQRILVPHHTGEIKLVTNSNMEVVNVMPPLPSSDLTGQAVK
jgi:mannose-6-phosphate isomerase class I